MSNLSKVAENIEEKILRPIKIMVISGSPRSENDCPGEYGKARKLVKFILSNVPEGVEYDSFDLSIEPDKPIVQPCKACYSSSPFLCHSYCSCYFPSDKYKPDLLADSDFFGRLEECHGFILCTPVHWYSVSTQVKSMFDRLISMNRANPWPHLTTSDDGKNFKDLKKARRLEILGEHDNLRKNNLQNRTAAFIIHGDGGANEYKNNFPISASTTFDVEKDNKIGFPQCAIEPIVSQCKYSGIHIRDEDILGITMGKGIPYTLNNMIFNKRKELFDKTLKFVDNYIKFTKKYNIENKIETKRSENWMNNKDMRKNYLDKHNKPIGKFNIL